MATFERNFNTSLHIDDVANTLCHQYHLTPLLLPLWGLPRYSNKSATSLLCNGKDRNKDSRPHFGLITTNENKYIFCYITLFNQFLCHLCAAVAICGTHHIHAAKWLGASHALQVVVTHSHHLLCGLHTVNSCRQFV